MVSLRSKVEECPRMKALSDFLRAGPCDSDRKWAAYAALCPDLTCSLPTNCSTDRLGGGTVPAIGSPSTGARPFATESSTSSTNVPVAGAATTLSTPTPPHAESQKDKWTTHFEAVFNDTLAAVRAERKAAANSQGSSSPAISSLSTPQAPASALLDSQSASIQTMIASTPTAATSFTTDPAAGASASTAPGISLPASTYAASVSCDIDIIAGTPTTCSMVGLTGDNPAQSMENLAIAAEHRDAKEVLIHKFLCKVSPHVSLPLKPPWPFFACFRGEPFQQAPMAISMVHCMQFTSTVSLLPWNPGGYFQGNSTMSQLQSILFPEESTCYLQFGKLLEFRVALFDLKPWPSFVLHPDGWPFRFSWSSTQLIALDGSEQLPWVIAWLTHAYLSCSSMICDQFCSIMVVSILTLGISLQLLSSIAASICVPANQYKAMEYNDADANVPENDAYYDKCIITLVVVMETELMQWKNSWLFDQNLFLDIGTSFALEMVSAKDKSLCCSIPLYSPCQIPEQSCAILDNCYKWLMLWGRIGNRIIILQFLGGLFGRFWSSKFYYKGKQQLLIAIIVALMYLLGPFVGLYYLHASGNAIILQPGYMVNSCLMGHPDEGASALMQWQIAWLFSLPLLFLHSSRTEAYSLVHPWCYIDFGAGLYDYCSLGNVLLLQATWVSAFMVPYVCSANAFEAPCPGRRSTAILMQILVIYSVLPLAWSSDVLSFLVKEIPEGGYELTPTSFLVGRLSAKCVLLPYAQFQWKVAWFLVGSPCGCSDFGGTGNFSGCCELFGSSEELISALAFLFCQTSLQVIEDVLKWHPAGIFSPSLPPAKPPDNGTCGFLMVQHIRLHILLLGVLIVWPYFTRVQLLVSYFHERNSWGCAMLRVDQRLLESSCLTGYAIYRGAAVMQWIIAWLFLLPLRESGV